MPHCIRCGYTNITGERCSARLPWVALPIYIVAVTALTTLSSKPCSASSPTRSNDDAAIETLLLLTFRSVDSRAGVCGGDWLTHLQRLLHVFEWTVDRNVKQSPTDLSKLLKSRSGEPLRYVFHFESIVSLIPRKFRDPRTNISETYQQGMRRG